MTGDVSISGVVAQTSGTLARGCSDVAIEWGLTVPMRDGASLHGVRYVPVDRAGAAPVVLSVTPYGTDRFHDFAMAFASRGQTFVIVDVRGRGNSDGRFQPFGGDHLDGHDAVEWVAAQPWCDGRVAMWGGSYGGFTQWAAARTKPAHLSTIVPVASPYLGVDFPMRRNILAPYTLQWLAFTSGKGLQNNLFLDEQCWSAIFRRWWVSGAAMRTLDSSAGFPSPQFQSWLDHPYPDDHWDALNPSSEDYARLDIPVLTITGSYDDDQPGALEHYRRHLAAKPSATHYLLIGPWDHAGTRLPAEALDDVLLGAASLIDLTELHLQWLDWVFARGERPRLLQAPVTYYVLGANRWRGAASLDAITARQDRLYLASSGSADRLYQSGWLLPSPGSGAADSYRHDPANIGEAFLDAETFTSVESLSEQRHALALSGRALFYHSAPFEADTEISGFFRLEAWIAIDCPDTDFHVSVHEVDLTGRSVRLATDAIRARYREDSRRPALVTTTEPLLYRFDEFTFISKMVRCGHRLRLVIAPMGRPSSAKFFERNPNNGAPVADEGMSAARVVTVTLFHDAEHPSALFVPIAADASESGAAFPEDQSAGP